MPEFAQYQVWLCDWSGSKLALLHASGVHESDFLSIAWQHKLNDSGVYRAEFVAETTTKDLFRVDYGILVERDYGAGYYEEYYGLHHNHQEWMRGSQDEHYWASSGLSPEWLIDQPILTPVPSASGQWRDYGIWWMHGPADNVMKAMVSENMGGGAAADRQFDYFSVEGDKGEGTWSCYDGRYDRLLQAVQGISGETWQTDFRVVRVSDGFEFRTYCPYYGTDRRKGHSANPTIFSLEFENVLNPLVSVKRSDEVTYYYGGWEGGGGEQDIVEAENTDAIAESPFRRREDYMDVSDVASIDTVPDVLEQALVDMGKVTEVTFNPVQTEWCLYGRDWALGDLVTLVLWGTEYDMRVTEVAGVIDGQNEEVIEGKIELWTRSETV